MTDLFWPGGYRAGELMTDRALVAALVRVELAWHGVLAAAGVAPAAKLPLPPDLGELSDAELAELDRAAEESGNPVIPLLSTLRSRLDHYDPEVAQWLHRGLTSQDVMDTALVLLLREVLDATWSEVARQSWALRELAQQHRGTLASGRTLTQHAVPITFGLMAATWLQGILDAAEDLQRARDHLSVQVGGAAGTLAAIAELVGDSDPDPAGRAEALAADLAGALALRPATPWHTNRRIITRTGDALVAVTDAWGRVANDVLVRVRPELGELSEGGDPSRGSSSTMPHKQNPVLSVQIRRAALTAPGLGASLHVAAAAQVDQRADGGWHAEWGALRTLARQTVVAARQATELIDNLVVHADRIGWTARNAVDDLLAEQRSIRKVRGQAGEPTDPDGYLGATDRLIDAAVRRANLLLEQAER